MIENQYSKVKMGLCPIGKFVFSHEDAVIQKKLIEEKLNHMGINYVGIDCIIRDGVVRSNNDVEAVSSFFVKEKVDCLFIPHCNFGTESAAGLIARNIGKPVLLWGPRDSAPMIDGTRLRDSLCGLFASSKVLTKLGVKFSYIENCNVNDRAFENGLENFIRAVNIVKSVSNAKIGMIGNRIDFFWSTIIDESSLLNKFGIEVLPIDLVRILRQTKELAEKNRSIYADESFEIGKHIDIIAMEGDKMINVLALRDAILSFSHENSLSAVAVESFMSLVEELGACISFSQAMVSDRGIPCICESDIHGAISSLIAEAADLGQSPSFFADLTVRHPDNESGLLLWHDAFPLSLKAPDCKGTLGSHWILPGFEPGMCHWRIKNGNITIMRFDAEQGQYSLIAKECSTIPGPFTQNTYVWVNVDDYKAFERKIIHGPYIHHTSCIYGHFAKAAEEACKYLDIRFDG